MTIDRRHVGKRLAQMVIHGPAQTVYLAGQVAADVNADITGQTQQVLAQIDQLLGQAGTDKSKLLSCTIFLPDINDYDAMNAVWEPWLAPGHAPARTTVAATLAAPGYRIEIQTVAGL